MIAPVTSPHVVVELRPPRLTTVPYLVSVVVAVVIVVSFLDAGGSPLFTAVFLAFAVGITGYNTATVLSRVRAYVDGSLEVRNRWTTRRLHRSDVDRVMVGRGGGFGTPWRVDLLLTDGTSLPLLATETPPFPGQRRRIEQEAAELRSWLG